MKYINLTKNKRAFVDDEDFDFINQWKWCYFERKKYSGYARRVDTSSGKRIAVAMHRLIVNAPDGMEVDHINHKTLDNRKQNLRVVTHSQNMANTKRRGIDWFKLYKKWRVRIAGKHIGYFEKYKDAVKIYKLKRKEKYGEYSYLDPKLV